MAQALFTTDISRLIMMLEDRAKDIREESGMDSFSFPVGLFFVIDEANGGDATAIELRRRFELLGWESKNFIDFYYIGWNDGGGFDLDSFNKAREFFKDHGVTEFGGNADLVLFDLSVNAEDVHLCFDSAIYIDLSERAALEKESLGLFLQNLVAAAEEVDRKNFEISDTGAVFAISDRLGFAYASDNFIHWILKKWGGAVGATGLRQLAVKKLGPRVPLSELRFSKI